MQFRIPVAILPGTYADGEVITAEKLNQIVNVLRTGVNANYNDYLKIIAGNNQIYATVTLEALQTIGESLGESDDGVYGLVLSGIEDEESPDIETLMLYQFDATEGEFVQLYENNALSFISILEKIDGIDVDYELITEEFEDINNTLQDHTDELGSLDTRVTATEELGTNHETRISNAELDIDNLLIEDGALSTRISTIESDYLLENDLIPYLTSSDAAATYQPVGPYAVTSQLQKLVKNIEFNAYNQTTGEIGLTFTFYDNTTATTELDLKLELIPMSGSYNAVTNALDFTLDNGTKFSVPVSDLLNLYYGDNATLPSIDAFNDIDGKSRFRINATWIADIITSPLATKLNTDGDGSAVTSTFTQASSLSDLTSGDTLAMIFGKVKKLYNSLGQLAFLNNAPKANLPSDTVYDDVYVHTDNNLTNQLVTDISDNKTARHTHTNKSQLDAIVGTRSSIALGDDTYDNYLATIGAIKYAFNLPDSQWDEDATTLGYKLPDVSATPDTVVVRDATGSANIGYSNTEMLATNVIGALDELQARKADVSALTSNIKLYPTTANADVSGYFKMVSTLTDPAYNTTAVEVPTGTITTQNQLIASLVADAGLFVGNPGVISLTTLGKIKKTAGNDNSYSEFYFAVYKRTLEGLETLQVTSDTTGPVNFSLNNYREFSANALLNNGVWAETDRVVIKYYANASLGSSSEYSFEFGGSNPVRTLLPVPVAVIPIADATGILTDTSNFTGFLSGADDTIQKALDKLDDHNHDGVYAPLVENKIPFDYLPSIALTDTFVVANTTEMTGLSVQVGDIAIVTEISKTFVLAADPASTLANWKEILTPADGVQSVTGSGAITVTGTTNVEISVNAPYIIPTAEEINGFATNIATKVTANDPITAGTNTKITYDAKGLVTSGTSLTASDIPQLAISVVNNLQDTLDSKGPLFADLASSTLTSSKTFNLYSDINKIWITTNTSGITLTIPADSTPEFPIGSQIVVIRNGSGTVTFSPASGVTLYSTDTKRSIKGVYSSAALLKIAANTWSLIGSIE